MKKSRSKTETSYSLSTLYLDDLVNIEISENRYQELLNAKLALVDAGTFEERYELMTENYKAFEILFVTQSLESRIGGDYRIEPASRTLGEANRLLMNFLTSFYSYTEQVRGEFKTTTSGRRFRSDVVSRLEKLRSSAPDFALLEVVRNFAQHVGMPIEGISFHDRKNSPWADSAYPFIASQRLARYVKSNNKRPIDLGPSIPKKVDLRALCYSGLREISKLHCGVREVIRDDCIQARTLIDAAIKEVNATLNLQFFKGTKERPARIRKIVRNLDDIDADVLLTSETLMLEWDDVRLARALKNARTIDDFKKAMA